MGYRVGIDFGTTYTKIAYVKDGQLQLFRYPGPRGRDYIPTAVAYRVDRSGRPIISIGEAAISDALNRRGTRLATRFKMFLPIRDPAQQAEKGWSLDRSPDEVVRDYFHHLLREGEYCFERQIGPIEHIVVSVPEVWQRTANNPGAEALRRVLIDEMGLPVDHLRSEPICAAAYYVHEYQRTEARSDRPFHLLICDMGGGTFDVALCRVVGRQIEVLDFDGNSEGGIGLAGSRFDHELVRMVYQAVEGTAPPEEGLPELVQAFEQVKIQNHDEASRELQGLIELEDPMLDDTPFDLYTFMRRYTPNLKHIRESFAPIARGIREVLHRLRQRAEARGWSIDRVAIVGGFGQFPLVQRAILESLDIRDPMDVRFDRLLHGEYRQFYAIAYGAALIAAGLIEPVEYYPHTLGIFAYQVREGRMTEVFVPIVEAGKIAAGQLRPKFASHPIRVKREGVAELPIGLQLGGTGQPIRLSLPPVRLPPPGRYRVGLLIDRSNMGILIFEPEQGGQRLEYRLGDVNPILTVEE
ncbi:Hsp70 family protein [Thermoflexus hugenholtzii]